MPSFQKYKYFVGIFIVVQPFSENTGLSNQVKAMEEETLLNECVKGNPKAQRALFDKFAPKMLGVCIRYMGNKELAEDVLQDGFVKVYTKLKDFKQEGSLEGWIRKIMVNTAYDQLRKQKNMLGDISADDVGYKIGDHAPLATDSLMAEDLMKLVHALPDGYRVVFNMFAIEGYSHAEIAGTLGISENTSKSQYSRARAYLRDKLEKLNG